MSALDTLTDRLKSKARAVGFDAVGVARVGAYPHADAFQEWLRNGMHGEMGYIPRAEDKRLDPTLVVEGARSIVSVAKLYRTQDTPDDLRDDRDRQQRRTLVRLHRHRCRQLRRLHNGLLRSRRRRARHRR